MRAEVYGQLFDVGQDVMVAYLHQATKMPLAQLGDSTAQRSDTDGVPLWTGPGFFSLPAPPTPGSPSCQTIVIKGTNHDIVIACRDTRASRMWADAQPGDSMLFGTGEQCNAANGRVVTRASGQIEIYATGCTIIVAPDGTVSMNASTINVKGAAVNLGESPSEGIVLGPALAAQLGLLATAQEAIAADMATVFTKAGVPSAPTCTAPISAFVGSLSTPNFSATCNASP
jgi:hypothetical protein